MSFDANKLKYILLESLPEPDEAFRMVMEYSINSGKNKWKCFGEVFTPYNHTIILIDEESNKYVGYGSGHIIEGDNFFLNHGYLRNGVINKDKIIDNIAYTVSRKIGIVIRKVKMTSNLSPRMWHMWGFKEDPMIAYEKEID